jgi:hypothetical protein
MEEKAGRQPGLTRRSGSALQLSLQALTLDTELRQPQLGRLAPIPFTLAMPHFASRSAAG